MSGTRYEPCPVTTCQTHGTDDEVVCNDCGGCITVHCPCETDPGRVVGGGMNLLASLNFGAMSEADVVETFMAIGRGDFGRFRS